ncbi:hypothetical protein JOB18_025459 [Solea senegalensis]|uniref:Uncharacterized protein n=1 Tax=Solea senegalensis TaxID=28829 RepID=A0AAV6SA59_SOLSE|nr:hypothetical protein JOB18_025459 [Solea senegalensis]
MNIKTIKPYCTTRVKLYSETQLRTPTCHSCGNQTRPLTPRRFSLAKLMDFTTATE